MHRIFVPIYHFFQQHKGLLCLLLAGSFLLFAAFGIRLRYEEDIVKLLPRSSTDNELAFSDIGLKDKVFIQVTSADPGNPADAAPLGAAVQEFSENLLQRDSSTCRRSSTPPCTPVSRKRWNRKHFTRPCSRTGKPSRRT